MHHGGRSIPLKNLGLHSIPAPLFESAVRRLKRSLLIDWGLCWKEGFGPMVPIVNSRGRAAWRGRRGGRVAGGDPGDALTDAFPNCDSPNPQPDRPVRPPCTLIGGWGSNSAFVRVRFPSRIVQKPLATAGFLERAGWRSKTMQKALATGGFQAGLRALPPEFDFTALLATGSRGPL